jgi:hypothetical protein
MFEPLSNAMRRTRRTTDGSAEMEASDMYRRIFMMGLADIIMASGGDRFRVNLRKRGGSRVSCL